MLAADPGSIIMPLLLIAVLVHGFAYDFIFIAGFLYVDKHVKEEVRAQAQGLMTVFTQGIGFLISSQIFSGMIFSDVVGGASKATRSAKQALEGAIGENTGALEATLQTAQSAEFDKWGDFWMIPCLVMVVVMCAFFFCFKEKPASESETELTADLQVADLETES